MTYCWKCGGRGWYHETEIIPIGGADQGHYPRQVARTCEMYHGNSETKSKENGSILGYAIIGLIILAAL